MRIILGLLALTLLGADAPPPPGNNSLSYEMCLLEMNGVEWRASVYSQMQSVSRQGNATVWTAPAEVARVLRSKAGRVLATPKLAANSGTTAHVSQRSNRHFVSDIHRVADGPVNHASSVAWVPTIENAREGLAATVTGRKLDQGVLTQVALDDTRVGSLHNVRLSEVQEPTTGKPGEKRWETMGVQIQVPEIARAEVAGEWLIPNDGVLVVSLGAYTTADEKGKAVVRERIALLEAHPTYAPAAPAGLANRPIQTHYEAVVGSHVLMPFSPTALPMPAPALPSRALPQPMGADGYPVALPPLPEDLCPPTAMPGSSEPCATPQTGKKGAEPVPVGPSNVPSTDRAAKQAGFEGPECAVGIAWPKHEVEYAAPEPVFPWSGTQDQAASAGKSFSFRLPFGGNVTVEVRAVSTPPAVVSKVVGHAPPPNSASPPPPDAPEAP